MPETPIALQRQVMLVSGVTLLAGLFLAASPLVLSNHANSSLVGYQFSSPLTTLNVALGMLIVAGAYFKATIGGATPWISWLLIAIGVIVLITPWTFNVAFFDAFRMPHFVVGGVVIVAELISAVLSHLYLAKLAKSN